MCPSVVAVIAPLQSVLLLFHIAGRDVSDTCPVLYGGGCMSGRGVVSACRVNVSVSLLRVYWPLNHSGNISVWLLRCVGTILLTLSTPTSRVKPQAMGNVSAPGLEKLSCQQSHSPFPISVYSIRNSS